MPSNDNAKTLLNKMKNNVTFGHFISVMSVFIIPATVWVITAEKRFQQTLKNEQEIVKIKNDIRKEVEARTKIEKDQLSLYTKILEKLHSIELKVENKQNRK